MAIKDVQASMQVPPAPAFDGNAPFPLSGDLAGRTIVPPVGTSVPVARDRTVDAGITLGDNPVRSSVGVLDAVQGLERYGSGAVHPKAPSTQATATPDTLIRNIPPNGPPTPGV